jgi:hypothetical protein
MQLGILYVWGSHLVPKMVYGKIPLLPWVENNDAVKKIMEP